LKQPDAWLELMYGRGLPPRGPGEPPRHLVKVRADTLTRHPKGVASAVLTLLLDLSCDELAETQRPAWLVATYDRVAHNEGHAEYFTAFGVGRASEVRTALADLGAAPQHRLLDEAVKRHMAVAGETSFVNGELDGRRPARADFSDLDAAYRALSGSTQGLLHAHLLAHVMHFVEVE
jgi:hypothetical protein